MFWTRELTMIEAFVSVARAPAVIAMLPFFMSTSITCAH
jgi:hypothetical protein